jgi:hypothetical protein
MARTEIDTRQDRSPTLTRATFTHGFRSAQGFCSDSVDAAPPFRATRDVGEPGPPGGNGLGIDLPSDARDADTIAVMNKTRRRVPAAGSASKHAAAR